MRLKNFCNSVMVPTGNIWWLAVHQQLPDVAVIRPVYQVSSLRPSLFPADAPSFLRFGVEAAGVMAAAVVPVAVVAMRP
jgi:hypothetical protein